MKKHCARSVLGLLVCALAPALHAVMPSDAEPAHRQRAGAPGSEVRPGDARAAGNDVLILLHRAATGSGPVITPAGVESPARCCEVSRATR